MLARRRLLAALLAAVAVVAGLQAVTGPPPRTVAVTVAARDLPAGVQLTAGDLSTTELAPGTAPDGVVGSPAGRTLAAPVRRGEPVTDLRLVGPDLITGSADLVAVPLRLPDPAMVALLRVGDRIDLLGADPSPSGEGTAATIAAGALVLALPGADETATSGLTGRLVVLGLSPGEVAPVSQAAVHLFLTFAYSR